MDNNSRQLNLGATVERTLPACSKPGRIISPLGWSAPRRLLWAAAAAAILWLAVLWAMDWL